jgi:hypothetical protein
VFDADAGDPEEVLTIAQRATHPVFSEPMLKSLGFGAPDVAIPRAFGGRNVICGVTLGERGTWWFDGQRLQLTPARPVHAIDTLGAGDTGMARSPLRWPRSSRSGRRCSLPPTWPHSSARGLAGAMASPLATRSMRFAPLFAEKQLNFSARATSYGCGKTIRS